MFNRPACQVYRTSNQTITTSTYIDVNFDAEILDTESIHDNATNNDRLTIQTPGHYGIHAMVKWASVGTTNVIILDITVASTTVITSNSMRKFGTSEIEQSVSGEYKLAANDIVRARVWQSSGSNLDLVSDGTFRPRLGIMWLGSG